MTDLILTLKSRFLKHPARHPGLDWAAVERCRAEAPAAELNTIGSLIVRWLKRAAGHSPTHDLSVRIGQ